MHELALAESLREIVESVAAEHGAKRIHAVHLCVGLLAAVEIESLRFCFDVVMAGGPAAHAQLLIESAPGRAWCWDCSDTVEIEAFGRACPRCAGGRLQVTMGTEMRVTDVEFESSPALRTN